MTLANKDIYSDLDLQCIHISNHTCQLPIFVYFTMGPFKCYITLEGVGEYMPKRYEALRGGGVTSAFFL